MLNSAIPWIVGFIVGVVISTVVSLLLCGCFFVLRKGSNRKRSIITENDIIDNNKLVTSTLTDVLHTNRHSYMHIYFNTVYVHNYVLHTD